MPENFLFEKDGPVITITFNRPERRNFLNREVMTDLEALIQRVRDDRETRVLILTSTGPVFSAGAEMPSKEQSEEERRIGYASRNKGLPRLIGRLFDQITRLDCMTIAAVNGHAIGGGWALVLGFDFVISAEDAEFWLPEVEVGSAFTGGPASVMAAVMGPWRAKEAIVLCRHFKASELFELGMITKVVATPELMPEAHQLARSLLKKPAKAARASKHFIDGVFVGARLY